VRDKDERRTFIGPSLPIDFCKWERFHGRAARTLLASNSSTCQLAGQGQRQTHGPAAQDTRATRARSAVSTISRLPVRFQYLSAASRLPQGINGRQILGVGIFRIKPQRAEQITLGSP